jgi:orotidine-5'-phosphate decarboxylase
MADPFAVRFAAAREKFGPLAFGADPHGPLLEQWGLSDDADGLERFTDIVLAAATDTVGLIKPQSAFYERHGWRGIRALTRLVESARGEGILVILDVKRGDVGSTNDAYAQAYLGPGAPVESDAVTVHPYLGLPWRRRPHLRRLPAARRALRFPLAACRGPGARGARRRRRRAERTVPRPAVTCGVSDLG